MQISEIHETSYIRISDREFDELDLIATSLMQAIGSVDEITVLDEVEAFADDIASSFPDLVDALTRIDGHTGPKSVVIELPLRSVADIPATPNRYMRPADPNIFRADIYRSLIVAVKHWYGYGFTSQQNGAIFNNVVSLQEFRDTPGHSGSADHTLDLHTEDASYNLGANGDISCDYISLHYFRNPDMVPTVIAGVNWGELSPQTRKVLSQESFVNLTNPGQGGAANDQLTRISIIYGPAEDPWLRFNAARLNLDIYDDDQKEALLDLRAHLESNVRELEVGPGCIAIIDNRRLLHGRPRFRADQYPRFDGRDRWQRRLVLARDRSRLTFAMREPRIVDPAMLGQESAIR